tara:strand:- start:150 stop:467 length:318 start_codon:yes stop_codon:yes gene_type:complete
LKNSISNQDFKQILFSSKSLYIRDLLFYYRKNVCSEISFIVSRNKGNAVVRNLFKRRCRALFDNHKNRHLQNMQIIIKPTKKIKNNYSWKELSKSFEDFSCKLEP